MRRRCAGLAATIFAVLGAIHIYWAAGGRVGRHVAIPERAGTKAFEPGPGMTQAVAAGLFAASGVMLTRAGTVRLLPVPVAKLGASVLALLFAARAIGDFNLVGFSKRTRGTTFATWDDRLFSPLCAVLSVLCLGASR